MQKKKQADKETMSTTNTGKGNLKLTTKEVQKSVGPKSHVKKSFFNVVLHLQYQTR